MRVLITGGAGFVGSHVADRLIADGHDVLLLDALLPQAHGAATGWRDGPCRVIGDVRDTDLLAARTPYRIRAAPTPPPSWRRRVHVTDVAAANALALTADGPAEGLRRSISPARPR